MSTRETATPMSDEIQAAIGAASDMLGCWVRRLRVDRYRMSMLRREFQRAGYAEMEPRDLDLFADTYGDRIPWALGSDGSVLFGGVRVTVDLQLGEGGIEAEA